MTIARSLLNSGNSFNVDGLPQVPDLPGFNVELLPKKFNVLLHKIGGKWNEFAMGSVVTFLEIDEWCELKGYKLVELYRGTRPAYPHERTDLL
jgi:hypothetical protein